MPIPAVAGQRSDLRASIGGSWGPWSLSLWGKNLTEDESAIDIIRYIDGSRGSLPNCPSFGNPDAICTDASPSSSPRGFGVTLPRERQFGATMTFRFGGE